jgi:shikimate kinase
VKVESAPRPSAAHFPLSLSRTASHAAPDVRFAKQHHPHRLHGQRQVVHRTAVAARLGFQFVDTDAVLVERDGREIAEIFAQDGEARFRDLETSVLESLGARNRAVISTGGGVILREKNRALLRELGFTVWLTASEDVIFDRVSRNTKRPLLHTANPRETVTQLLTARQPWYEASSQFTVDTSTLAHAAAADAVIAEARRAFSWDTAG